MKKRKFLSVVLAMCMVLSLLPANFVYAADETGDFTVSGGSLGTDYSYSDNVLTILKSTELTISGTTTKDRIVVASGVEANLVLSNLSITTVYTNESDNSPLSLKDAGKSTITLQEGTTNTLDGRGAGNYAPGIFVPDGSLLTINGTGKLTAKGSGYWPGIGRNGNGNLRIESGTITAIGGNYAAGIGGSMGFGAGNITITGGTITANGGQYADGIGCGRSASGGNITINGGTITATGGDADWRDPTYGIGGTLTTGTNGGAVIITNSIQNTSNSDDWSGVIFIGSSCKVYGNPTIATDEEIPSGKTLTIESGKTITVGSGTTLTNNGTIIVNDGGKLINNGSITGNGAVTVNSNGSFENNGSIDGNGTITVNDGGKMINNVSIDGKVTIYMKSSGVFVNNTTENNGKFELVYNENNIVLDGQVTIPSDIIVTNEGKIYVKNTCVLTINGGLNNRGEILYLKPVAVPDNLEGIPPVALLTPGDDVTPGTVYADGADVTITDEIITINHKILGTVTESLDSGGYIFKSSTGSLNITVSEPLQLTLDHATIITALNQIMSIDGVVYVNLIGESTIGFDGKDAGSDGEAGITMTDASEIHFSTETDGSVTIKGNYRKNWVGSDAVKGGNLYVENGTVTAISSGKKYGDAVGKAFNGKTLTVNGGTFNGYRKDYSISSLYTGETLAETITVADGAVLNTNYRRLAVDSAEISLSSIAEQTADLPSQTVTISNTGNLKSQGLQAQENSNLNVTLSKNEIDAGGSITATVTPKANLTAGEYTEVITVKGSNNEKIQFTVKLKVKERITFDVSDTVHVYKAGEAKAITFVPSALTVNDFVVKYYEVDENNGVLKSVLPVSRAIASGCYLYVIDLVNEQEDYGISNRCTVTDTALPEISTYDNVGYMHINAAEEQQLPIYFDNTVVNAHMTDAVTNPLNNPNNASTVTYESKNTSVAEVDAGTGEVTIKGAGSAVIVAVSKKKNASDVYASYTLNVTKEAVTVTADSSSVEYGTEKTNILSGYTVSKDGVTLNGTPVYTTAYEKGSGCGQYSVTVSGLTSDIYEIVFAPGTLTVTPKKLSLSDLSIAAADKVYDGSDKAAVTASVKDTSLVSGDIVNVLVSGSFASENASESTQTVSYTVSGLSGTHSGNYMLTGDLTGTASAIISKAPVTVSVPATTTYVYDGEEKSVNAVAYANGMYFDKFNVTYTKDGSTAAPKGVGTYEVGIEITDSNYVLSDDISAQLIIRPAQQDFFSIEGIADTVTYGDAPFRLQADGAGAGASVTYEVTNGTAAEVTADGKVTIKGVGPVTVKATSTLVNHTEKTATRTFTVKPKTLNVTAEPKSADKVYDGTKTVDVTLSLDGVVRGDTVTADCTSAAAASADVENNKTVFVNGITLSGADAGKYQLASTSVQTSVNVTKKPVTAISFAAADKVYDGSIKADYTVTNLEGVLDQDKAFVTVSGSAEFEDANAGESKTVTLKGLTLSGTKSGNYELQVTGDVTAESSISKAKVVFTLGTLEYTYDGTKKTVPVSATVNGAAYSNYTVEYRVDGVQAETVNAGEYDVVITLGDTTNYETAYTPKKLKIVQASQSAITITGLIGTIDYGAEFALSAVGGNGSGAVTWSSSNTAIAEINENTGYVKIVGTGSPVTITATKAGDENFGGGQSASVTFTPIKKSVGFRVTNLTHVYDGTEKSVTVTPSVGSDNYTVTYTDEDGNPAAAPTDAGIYYADVHATGHYDGYTAAVLTIRKAEVNTSGYTFEVADAVYGSTPVVTQPGSTEYPNGVTAKVTYTGSGIYSETAEQPKNAGSYTAILTISGDNYETVRLTDSFVIAKAELTAKPDNKSRAYGEQNPVFTISYSGFVNGDNESAVMTAPSMTTDATAASSTGTYAIKASGGYAENYTFKYEDGTLTVGAAGGGNFYIHGGQSNPYVGDKFTLTAYYNNEKPTVTWSSDNTAVATVSTVGEVKIIGSGTATITAKMNDSRFDSSLTAKFTLNASYLPETQSPIYFDSLLVEKYVTDGAFTNPAKGMSDGATVKYTSSNTEVAEVNETSGEVTIHKAGTAVIKATSTKFNCADVYASYTLTVKKTPITVSAKDITITYGDSFTDTDITISGGVTADELGGTLGFTTKYAAGRSAGEYDVTPNGLTSDTYDITFESGTITVNEKVLTKDDFTITAENKTYDGTTSANISAAVNADALVGTDNLRAEVSGNFADENAGANKEVSYKINSLSGRGFENYVLGTDVNTADVTASITPAKVTFFVSEETTRIYDGTVQKVDISAMALGNVFGESSYTVYYQAEDGGEKTTEPKNAGEYTVSVELTDESGNYEAIQPTAKLIIKVDADAKLYISGANRNVTVDDEFTLRAYYGNQTPEVTWSSSDETVAEVDDTTGEVTILKAGTATITASAKDANYGSAEFKLEAAKKRINIKAPAGELVKIYNGKRQDINFTSSDIDLKEKGITVDASYVLLTDSGITEPNRAGTYTVSYEINDARYTADGNVMLTINKATLKARVKDDSKVYGDEYTGYELEITDKGGMVDAAAADAFADMKAVTTYASDGAAKTAFVKDGGYEITAELAKIENDNVKFSVEKGTLTVTKAPLTVTVKNVSREYGAENPALEVEYEGFKNGETEAVLEGSLVLSYDESINGGTPVNTYTGKTTASGLTSGNYDITFVPGNVTVTKIGVTASAGTSRSSYITIKLDKAVAGLTADNFVVKKGNETISLTEAAVSNDNKTYTLKGSFSTADTYTVQINLAGTESGATHEIISGLLSVKPLPDSSAGGGGGGGIEPSYSVCADKPQHGYVSISPEKAAAGTAVTVTVTPDEGYTLETLTVTDDSGKTVAVTVKDGRYTFIMPDSNVSVKAAFMDDSASLSGFSDVSENDYFYDAVLWAVKHGITEGTSEATFSPYADCTRAQIVTFLWRAAGCPEPVSSENPFTDVKEDAYYYKAVLWAVEKGITQGTGNGTTFGPELVCTRDQSVTFLWRSAGKPDGGEINPFTDVKDGEWYSDAVLWAVGESITEGTGSSTFSPDENCTRGQIVTFLYRSMN